VDNGNEFSGKVFYIWAYNNKVQTKFSRPGKQTNTCFIETVDGSLRGKCLKIN